MTPLDQTAAAGNSESPLDQLVTDCGTTLRSLGILIRLRAIGASGRAMARWSGMSKSTFARVWLPTIDALVSQLGQTGWNEPRCVAAALARDPVALSYLGQKERKPRPPLDSESGRFLAALATLTQLTNRDPNDIVGDLDSQQRDMARRQAARIAAWLKHLWPGAEP
jgi:hypothetical protein